MIPRNRSLQSLGPIGPAGSMTRSGFTFAKAPGISAYNTDDSQSLGGSCSPGAGQVSLTNPCADGIDNGCSTVKVTLLAAGVC